MEEALEAALALVREAARASEMVHHYFRFDSNHEIPQRLDEGARKELEALLDVVFSEDIVADVFDLVEVL